MRGHRRHAGRRPAGLRAPADRDGCAGRRAALTVGSRADRADPDALIAEAVEAARAADVAVVVVGTNSKVESEGYDRDDLACPGRQDDLVRAVVAANPRTVVVVNAGAPVLLPWRDEVAALLVGWFGGQEYGNALADVLLGVAEPGGRLPTTWPADGGRRPGARPAPRSTASCGTTRASTSATARGSKARTEPAYWFGTACGYTA